jgi:cation diffusion facilitator family transporter
MTPQRRTALGSVVAALVLIALKLGTGLATGSLGLLSEAAHSGTDLVAALLTFFALGVAVRPPDSSHPYGHDKAEHLAALAEAAILIGLSGLVAWHAVRQVSGVSDPTVDPALWAIGVVVVVIAIDASRATISYRASRRYHSAALEANALHFASDLAGSTAVLLGLLAARAGWPEADAVAALFVAMLVLMAAGRLIARNVDVLMDRTPTGAHEAAAAAIAGLTHPVELRRLRMRTAGGRHFADVVIGVPPGAAVGQGHAAADAVEAAVQRALPGSDIVVHVEPVSESELRERAQAAALGVARVREVHNVSVLTLPDRAEVSLHLKLPGNLPLEEAHGIAEEVEGAILGAVPEIVRVHTHLEPLREPAGAIEEAHADEALVRRVVRDETGIEPREVRFLRSDDRGLTVLLTLALEADRTLAEAHGRASAIEERIRRERPAIDDVIVHTEP